MLRKFIRNVISFDLVLAALAAGALYIALDNLKTAAQPLQGCISGYLKATANYWISGTAHAQSCSLGETLSDLGWLMLPLAFAIPLIGVLRWVVSRIRTRRIFNIDSGGANCRVLVTGISPWHDPNLSIDVARSLSSTPEIMSRYYHDRTRKELFDARIAEIDAIVARKQDEQLAKNWQALRDRATGGKNSYLGPWQQAFRACYAQRDTLRKLYVLPSHESKGQLGEFQAFINALMPNLAIEQVAAKDGKAFQLHNKTPDMPQSRDYEEYEYVSGGIERAIEMAKEQFPDIGNDEIGIDMTPGQKPFSVAAAVKTLNEDYVMLYVTNFGEIKLYKAWVQLGKSSAVKEFFGS